MQSPVKHWIEFFQQRYWNVELHLNIIRSSSHLPFNKTNVTKTTGLNGVSEHRWDPWTRSSKNFSVEKLRNANFNQSHQLKESHDIWEPNISLNLQPSRKIWQIWVLRLPGWNCSADLTMVGDSIDDDEPVEFDLKTTATRRWTFSSSCWNRREGKNSTVSSLKWKVWLQVKDDLG